MKNVLIVAAAVVTGWVAHWFWTSYEIEVRIKPMRHNQQVAAVVPQVPESDNKPPISTRIQVIEPKRR